VRVRLGSAPRPWAAVWQLSLPVALATLIVSLATWLCLVLLAQRPGGVAEVGGFNAANQLRALIAFLPAQLMAALLPVLFTVMRDGHDRAAQLQRRVTLASAAAAALVALPLALAASPVLDLYGAGFAVFAPVLVLLSAKGVLESASLPLQRILVACDRAWMLVAANGAFGLLLLGLGLALIGPHGAAGLAASLMIAQSVHLLIQWKLSRSALVSRAAG
jgi:O-antigen/teichoic acid export membrane protein